MPSRNCGFDVSRTYCALDNKDDVVSGVDEKGHKMYTIKAGSNVQIKVVMVAAAMRSHVALVVRFHFLTYLSIFDPPPPRPFVCEINLISGLFAWWFGAPKFLYQTIRNPHWSFFLAQILV